MSLDKVIEEMFDLVFCRRFTEKELIDHIIRTYGTTSPRIIRMILDWCEAKIKEFEDHLWLH